MNRRPLWTCPKCGRKFVTRNLWHSCGPYTVETFLEGKGPRARNLFARFRDLVRSCGPLDVSPAKTRIAFMVRVRFAGVSNLSDRGMTIAFALTRRLTSPRVRRVERFAANWYGHYMRITSPGQLDDELRAWLCEAYEVGEQRHLRAPA